MILSILAQEGAAPSQGGSSIVSALLPMVLIIAVFYFLLIRPQQKQQRRHREMVANAKRGDQVVTASGIHGKISAIDNDIVMLEIADGIEIKIDRNFIQMIAGYPLKEKKAA